MSMHSASWDGFEHFPGRTSPIRPNMVMHPEVSKQGTANWWMGEPKDYKTGKLTGTDLEAGLWDKLEQDFQKGLDTWRL